MCDNSGGSAGRPPDDEPLATCEFVPGAGRLLTAVVDLVESERPVDLSRHPPLGERVDWDSLDRLLDDESRAMNVESVTFSYRDLVVEISGAGRVSIYDDSAATDA